VDETQLPSGVVRVAAPADFFDLFPIEWVARFMADHAASAQWSLYWTMPRLIWWARASM